MSGIDAVIARARRSDGGFSERKTFSLARRRAIEKIRKFALADPFFYVLELVQAAVANGATYIDIQADAGDLTMSWVGGRFSEEELAQLFDFLFASKERLDLAHVRSLALGINAALLFEPRRIVIESGDGSMKGTARMVLEQGAETVEVGRADTGLAGTFVRIEKLRRRKVARKLGRSNVTDSGSVEFACIETRCLSAPVPIIFNSHPMFGYSALRSPGLFGYRQARAFDEGDLYGTIGLNASGSDPVFKLLTFGVWVQSYAYDLLPGHRVGGIVCFDRLHKTADHSGFVQDDRFDELWLRIRPYAEALAGQTSSSHRVVTASGRELSTLELRELLSDSKRVVAVPPDVEPGSERHDQARAISVLLDAELLKVPREYVGAMRAIAGSDVEIVAPRLSAEEIAFFASEPPGPPPEPWLARPLSVPALSGAELRRALMDAWVPELPPEGTEETERQVRDKERQRLDEYLSRNLVDAGTVTATVYAPVTTAHDRGLRVRVLTLGRPAFEERVASAFSGQALDIVVPPTSGVALQAPLLPGSLARRLGVSDLDLPTLGDAVAAFWVERARGRLSEQLERAIDAMAVGELEPGTGNARLAATVLSRTALARLRSSRPGRLSPGLGFSLLHRFERFDPLALEVFETLDGTRLGLRQLATLSDETGGLLFGVVPDVEADLDSLQPSAGGRILRLDVHTERALLGLVSDGGYVRVDGRDVLAMAAVGGGTVVVRDVATGLAAYPDFPLLVEGDVGVLDGLDVNERAEVLADLVAKLRALATSKVADAEAEELARHAIRHLQWVSCRLAASGDLAELAELGLLDFPLFRNLDGEFHGIGDVVETLADSSAAIVVHHAHAMGGSELGELAAAARNMDAPAASGRVRELAVAPFAFRLLLPLGAIVPALDFDLDEAEARDNPLTGDQAFLTRIEIHHGEVDGVVGVPGHYVERPHIRLTNEGGRTLSLMDDIALEYRVVGHLHLVSDDVDTAHVHIAQAAQAAVAGLVDVLPDLNARDRVTAERVLLSYAAHQMLLFCEPGGHLRLDMATPLAERILDLPLFPVGRSTPATARRLIDGFCREFTYARQPRRWGEIVSEGATHLVEWLESHVRPDHVASAASRSRSTPTPQTQAAPVVQGAPLHANLLGRNLEYWLAELRVDEPPHDVNGRSAHARVWVQRGPHPDRCVHGHSTRLEVEETHWLVQDALRDAAADPVALAWLLLACYAYLNDLLHPVTNEHERLFQGAVSQALRSGALRVLAEPPAVV